MNFIGIIPARYASTRLEGKPLMDIHGKSMIERVYLQSKKAIEDVWVATDDKRIYDEVESFGGKVIMTSSSHLNGTTRCYEALLELHRLYDKKYDVVINIQGDEPMLNPSQLIELMNCFHDENTTIATLATEVNDNQALWSGTNVFLVKDIHDYALYFSRAVIPYMRDVPKNEWLDQTKFYKHIGLYGYTAKALRNFVNMKPSSLENSEKLEQNRWIENGEKIKIGYTNISTISVDTISDLEYVRELMSKNNN